MKADTALPIEGSSVRMRRVMLVAGLALPLVLAGCQQDEEIKSYEVRHPQREKIRMLTATIPDGESTYFVVLKGPEAAVAERKKAFDDLVASIRVDNKKDPPITWTTPNDWDEEKGTSKLRIAGFKMTVGATKMEAALTKLDKLGGPGEPNSLLDNVNRWRGQVELPPAVAGDLEKLVRRDKIDGREVILADIRTGLGIHKAPSKAPNPHAGGMPPIGGGMPPIGRPKGVEERIPFIYEVPAGWSAKEPPLPGFAVAAYLASDGARKAMVTLTPLRSADLVANVNRWRKDTLGMRPATPEEVESDARALTVAGIGAKYVDLVNAQKKGDNRVLGVIIPTDDGAWVIRMFGPDDLIGREKANFETFLKSFKTER